MQKTLTIIALGSRGDVQPYIALGGALQAAGYRVRVATFQDFAPLVARLGLLYHSIPGDAKELVRLAMAQGMLTDRNPFKMMAAIRQSYGRLAADYATALSDPALFDSDAILNQLPGGLFGTDLAERLAVPHITLSVIPLTPTSAFANPLLTTRSLGGLLNRLSWGFSAQLVWSLFRPYVAQQRRTLGLSKPPPRWLAAQSPGLVLNGFSPQVISRPADWGSNVHVTGWWQLAESDWQPSPALAQFLAAGPAPVFIGFGSMIASNAARLNQVVRDAIEQSGVRAVIGQGWGVGSDDVPKNVFRLEYAPYAWLFPKMAGVVHHGGSGTTGLALHSGVPSMVMPFGADQPYWGLCSHRMGVGPRPLPVAKASANALAEHLTALTTTPHYRQAASELGAALSTENGLESAVTAIQKAI